MEDLGPKLITIALALAICLPFHEFAHAFSAYRLGDGTAKAFGRLTLDPRAHFDPIGGLFLALTVFIGFGFGWAKPTPVSPYNLRVRFGEAIVAAAGPLTNLGLAAIGGLVFRLLIQNGWGFDAGLVLVAYYFVSLNVGLAIFNFIPIPPLDGSKLLFTVLHPETVHRWRPVLEQSGFLFLFLLIIPLPGTGQSIVGIIFELIGFPLISLFIGL